MSKKYQEYKGLNLPNVAKTVMEKWDTQQVFEQSVTSREGKKPYVFFEGPPSANGLPGIHHVMARSIKDIFCRYQTLKGFQVKRKAGWDTHGLPVELGVEKELGITKEDIGTKISVEDYNTACKNAVMRYTDIWNNLTKKMGYWVDMDHPYITYEPKYMESVWWLLGELYKKNLLYKGYTIQPYSPKAGTGLSSHELNQPGCYRDVTDTTVVAQFKVVGGTVSPFGGGTFREDTYFLAWTTTPWTLPSNTALTVGPKIDYVLIKTFNQYTFREIHVILAENLVNYQFGGKYTIAETEEELTAYSKEDKKIPYLIVGECTGADLVGIRYEQLLPYALPYENAENAFQVIPGDFVTTEDGTGIVHTAPTFGADDAKVAADAGVPGMLVLDEHEKAVPLVDLQGRFRPEMGEFAGMYVKNDYYNDGEAPEKSADVQLAIKLKEENKAFKVEKYVHSYPHCWRTNKPVLYYPLDSWFIRVTNVKERMIALNNTINWKPESTGSGRFGKWLENANDWNLSRSRYWGIPIPIWRTEDGSEEVCISSVEQLKNECDKAVQAGIMSSNPLADFEAGNMADENYAKIDLHKNYVDSIVLVSESGKPMKREADLCDVWFDSGSMPYAQWHYPFENKELIDNSLSFPADFIAEGVDQTRGWFYTLHAIATMVFDSVAYKNVVSNGLVLDKNGQKMSKSVGNTVDPFETLSTYGPDATRWYMITNAQPWDNLRFDLAGITEVRNKFFGTLTNTYNFFALYANLDNFVPTGKIDPAHATELDKWILSKLQTLILEVGQSYESYEPTKAGRAIQEFVTDQLSNWYVRLGRRRFWKGELTADKTAAYETLAYCLTTVSQLMSPIAPFYSDWLYRNLTGTQEGNSVHVSDFPTVQTLWTNEALETAMDLAQRISSLVHSIRKTNRLKVRQPLSKVLIPVLNKTTREQIASVEELIKNEVNIKSVDYLDDTSGVLSKKVKPNFKALGPKFGKEMKAVAEAITSMTNEQINQLEKDGSLLVGNYTITPSEVEILTEDLPGYLTAQEGGITVALDITLTDELRKEGIARDVVNRIQNYRKENGFEVTDKIKIQIKEEDALVASAIRTNEAYICQEVQAVSLIFEADLPEATSLEMDDLIVSAVISRV